MYYLYLLECRDGTLYTGIARDVSARVGIHAAGRGSKYVRARGVGRVVYTEPHTTLADALRRERQIKSWRRPQKLALANTV